MEWGKSLTSFFGMWISSCPGTICWRDHSFRHWMILVPLSKILSVLVSSCFPVSLSLFLSPPSSHLADISIRLPSTFLTFCPLTVASHMEGKWWNLGVAWGKWSARWRDAVPWTRTSLPSKPGDSTHVLSTCPNFAFLCTQRALEIIESYLLIWQRRKLRPRKGFVRAPQASVMESVLPPRGLTLVRGPLCLFRQFPGGIAQLRKHFLCFGKLVSPRVQKRDGLSVGPVRAQRLLPPPTVAGRELVTLAGASLGFKVFVF